MRGERPPWRKGTDEAATRLLRNPRWSGVSAKGFAHRDQGRMEVEAPGLDGRTVRFVVEQGGGSSWALLEVCSAKVQGGRAAADLSVAHPSLRNGDHAAMRAAGHAQLRFHADVA